MKNKNKENFKRGNSVVVSKGSKSKKSSLIKQRLGLKDPDKDAFDNINNAFKDLSVATIDLHTEIESQLNAEKKDRLNEIKKIKVSRFRSTEESLRKIAGYNVDIERINIVLGNLAAEKQNLKQATKSLETIVKS